MRAPFWPEAHYVAIPSLGLAYGRVPKAANSTIKLALARSAGIEDRFPQGGVSKDRCWQELAPTAYFLSAAALQRKFPELLVFSFVREPMSRLASCYRGKVSEARKPFRGFMREGLSPTASFAEFVHHVASRTDGRSNTHYRAQAAILTRRGRVVPDFIGRYETFTQDWARLSEALRERGAPGLAALPKRGRNRAPADPAAYFEGSPRLLQLARARYAEDYRLFYPELA